MLPIIPATGRLSDFKVQTQGILFGEKLKAVRALSRSIQRYGLFNPIIVMKDGDKLMVVDGRKRIIAMRRMQFQGRLPRSLVRIPYIVVEQSRKLDPETANNPLKLLSNAEQYEYVKTLRSRGRTLSEISKILFTPKHFVRNMLSVDRLSQKLKGLFLRNQLTVEQAHAFAALPDPKMQDVLIEALGPFASEKDILIAGSHIHQSLNARRNDTGKAKPHVGMAMAA